MEDRIFDATLERRLLTGLIVSTDILQSVFPILKAEYFSSTYAQTVAQWVIDYYKIYKKAPNKDIREIFNQSG